MTQIIGLLINPVAGIGGPAGLKGSDGLNVQAAALARGAHSRSAERAVAALGIVAAAYPQAEIVSADGDMGADAVRAAGLSARVVYHPSKPSSAMDTTAAATAISEAGAGVIFFVGGDGTARDVAAGVHPEQPVLGIPAGVKMYSGCFAVSPAAAGALATRWLGDQQIPLTECEVLDVDEEQIRHGTVDPHLFALVQVPFLIGRTQSRKTATPVSEGAAVRAAASGAIAEMNSWTHYLLGPGGTTSEIARQLGVEKTPLGVDVVRGRDRVLADASEQQLLQLIESLKLSETSNPSATSNPAASYSEAAVKAVITVIGGQGFLLGRGNQQISARVIDAIGTDPLVVVATEEKLALLLGQPLLVDTGSATVDRRLAGYIRVITGVSSAGVYPVTAPELTTAASLQPLSPIENEGAQSCV
ncbi:MAG: ATP-NAD kinase family protein [Rhodoglobus sp.]